MVGVIIVDSNIWIFAESESAPEHALAVDALQRHLSEGLAINAVIFSEVFHHLKRIFGGVAKERVQKIITHPAVGWLDFGADDALAAMELCDAHELKVNDAMIAQQALREGVAVLTDNTKDFKRVKGLKVVSLRTRTGG